MGKGTITASIIFITFEKKPHCFFKVHQYGNYVIKAVQKVLTLNLQVHQFLMVLNYSHKLLPQNELECVLPYQNNQTNYKLPMSSEKALKSKNLSILLTCI